MDNLLDNLQKRTWAEISLCNLEHNYRTIRSAIPDRCKFLGIVKADAYGHGALQISSLLEKLGADYLAVSCLDEALELRRGGIFMPILILGHTPPEYTDILIENHITQTVTNLSKAREYSHQAVSKKAVLKIHYKVDTGMSRLGFLPDHAAEHILEANQLPGLSAEGIYTHFSVSDDPSPENIAYTKQQFHVFTSIVTELDNHGVHFAIRHCANSGAVINFPEMCLDMVRPGLLLYGYGDNGSLHLKPCMRLVSTVSTIKHYPAGTFVSYGRRYVTERRTRMGVVAIGYADGLPRITSGKCSYYAGGGYAPQCGSICMDMCMADLTNIPEAAVGSEVEIFGEHNSILSLSEAAGTIPYELLCSVSKRVPRIYKGQAVK